MGEDRSFKLEEEHFTPSAENSTALAAAKYILMLC
jgi:hypothetical protein